MFRRRVRLISALIVLALCLTIGSPFKSKTAELFNAFGNLLAQLNHSQPSPQSTSTRAFSGSLPASTKLNLNVARRNHTATALSDGKVLFIGGDNQEGSVIETELFDPKSSTLAVTARSLTARTKHSATLLADGKVLVTGGSNGDGALDSTEIFDPRKNAFVEGPRMQHARAGHSATLLADGKVLIAGGSNDSSAELYDPAKKQFALISGQLTNSRAAHSTLLLSSGDVLLVGGKGANGRGLESAEIFNATTQRFSPIASAMMMPRVRATLRALPDGKVQIIGGDPDGSMEIYDPRTGQFAALAHLAPTADLFSQSQMLSAATRAGFTDASTYRDAQSPYQFSKGLNSAFKKQELGRTNYAVAEFPASHLAIVAGGSNDDRQILSSVLAMPHSTATISTTEVQYRPGQAPIIIGTGWQAGEIVNIIRQTANLKHERITLRAVADAQGNFVCADITAAVHQNWTTYTLTANGKSSGQIAQTVYQDLPPVGKEKETLGLLKFNVPISSRVISVETETVTVKLTPDGATVNEEGSVNATVATCTIPSGNTFNIDVDFSNVISKPCFGTDTNPCAEAGDVQLKDACLTISGSINAELCLLCDDGMGGFIDPYAKFAIQENFKQQAVLAVALSRGLRLSLFKIPIPKVSVVLTIPGINPRIFEATLGLTVYGELEAIVHTPASFEVSMALAQGFETGFDTRQSPAGYLRTTTPPNASGNINVFTLGDNSVRFKLGPNVGLTVNAITTIIDFGENLLGFLEVNLTDAGATDPTCILGNVDLFGGMEGNIFLKAFAAPELRLSYDFFRLRIPGFPKPVAIKDTKPPDIIAPDVIQSLSLDNCLAKVSYTPVILDSCSGVDITATTVTPPSGSSFPLGNTTVTVKAKDNKGNEATKTFQVLISCPPIALPATLASGVVGTAYSQSAAATPVANYGYTVKTGALPPGLSLNPSTGLLSGTPLQAGAFNFTIQATSCTCSGSMTYTLNIVCPTISITRIGESFVTATQPYNATLTALPASGNYTYSISAGALPSGMNLSSDGKITGSSATPGLSTFTVRAIGFGGACQGTQQFTILVTCQNFDIGLFSATGPVAGIPFDGNLKVRQFGSAVSGNYTFTHVSGTLPPGLTLTPDGHLFGTPSQVGSFISVGFTAEGDSLCPSAGFLNFTINCPTTPATLSNLPYGQAFVPYDQTLTTSIGSLPYTYQVIAGTLPPGLTLSPTGRLFGTPTRADSYNFTIKATDTAGCSGTGVYNFFRIDCPTIIFTSPTSGGTYLLPDGTFGAAYNQTVSVASPAGFTYTYSVIGTLPPGLTLNPNGTITGTPTGAGQYTFGISATAVGNGFGACSGSSSFRLTIPCPTITIPPLPNATITVPYDQTLMPLPAEGAPYIFDNVFGPMPPGLSFDAATGRLYGTPTQTGNFTFRVRARGFLNNACSSDTIASTVALTVECPAVTTSPLPNGTATVPYNQTLTSTPSGSYTFSLAGGTLPPGLSFVNGVISGTPTQPGTYNFDVTATATSAAINNCTRTLPYTITINCPTITLSALPGGTVTVAYNQTITAAPVGGGYSFALTGGSLPPGLNFANGNISGIPTKAGTYNFTITATGFGNCTGQRAYSFVVTCPVNTPPPTITCPTNVSVATSGNSAVATWNAPTVGDNCYGANPPTCNPAPGSSFNVGVTTVTCTVTDTANQSSSCSFTVTVNRVTGSVSDPVICTGPGNTVQATMVITNNGNANQTVADTTTFTNLVGVPNTCTVTPNVGTCVVTNGGITYNASLTPGQTVTIRYLTEVGDLVQTGQQVCTNNSVTFNNGAPYAFSACGTANCPTVGPANPIPARTEASDQKAGSVLIYNVYTSGATSGNTQNTRINLTNTHPRLSAFVHLFFVSEGCSVADNYICLTANQTASFLTSDLDPGTTGYLVAVAVDGVRGCPTDFNYLIGDEYVKFSSGHAANLNAIAFSALSGGLPACDGNSVTALLNFDGVSYNRVPAVLALSNVGSRADGNDTMLILNRIGGNLGTGATTLGSLFGILYDDTENALSFSVSGNCQLRNSITNNFPRTTPRFESFIPAGRTGWAKVFSQTGTVGITGAAINFNANAASSAGAFNQGHNLHVMTLTTASYVIPVFPPSC